MSTAFKRNAWAYAAGLVFGLGLCLSGMTNPAKVIAFLDFTGAWDASLMLVMGGAVAVYFVAFRVITRRAAPLFDTRFHLPTVTDIDAKLTGGAAIFGVGWGLSGFCPGPGIVSLGAGSVAALVFVAAMTLGILAQQRSERWGRVAFRATGC